MQKVFKNKKYSNVHTFYAVVKKSCKRMLSKIHTVFNFFLINLQNAVSEQKKNLKSIFGETNFLLQTSISSCTCIQSGIL